MSKERADLGFADDLDELDVSDFQPSKPKEAAKRPGKEETVKAAQAAGFQSREPAKAKSGAGGTRLRRRRTGRTQQLNLKVTTETLQAFYKISDQQGWVLGETLEHAVALLEKEYGTPDARRS